MKNKIILIALILTVSSILNATEVDFDGKVSGINIRKVISGERFLLQKPAVIVLKNNIRKCENSKSERISKKDYPEFNLDKSSYLSLNESLKRIIKKYENKSSSFIVGNLKKLLIYGSFDEKLEFMRSKCYNFPDKFNLIELNDINSRVFINRSMIQVCEDVNCRTETVCGFKERCELVTSVACGVVVTVGGDIISVNLVVGTVVGGVPCYYVTKKVCKNVDDCEDVEKCAIQCVTGKIVRM